VTEAARRKSLRIHQSKIDRAMRILGTRTESGTIEAALDLVTFGPDLVEDRGHEGSRPGRRVRRQPVSSRKAGTPLNHAGRSLALSVARG
jgi:hypothetical protein